MSEVNSTILAEEWRDVIGFEGIYQVSNLGRVRSLTRKVKGSNRWGTRTIQNIKGKILKATADRISGHVAVYLRKNGRYWPKYVHRLVLETFIGPCPEGMQCRHFPDRDPANNCLDNLQWGTREENMADMVIHGTRRIGWSHSAEAIAKISAALKNPSKETRAKMSASAKRRWAREKSE